MRNTSSIFTSSFQITLISERSIFPMLKTKEFTLTATFLAIILLFAFTPIGFIQLGLVKATLIQIPVILSSIVLGPKIGAFLGTVFGISSIVVNTTAPSLVSFVFSPVIPV